MIEQLYAPTVNAVEQVTLESMYCANKACGELIVRLTDMLSMVRNISLRPRHGLCGHHWAMFADGRTSWSLNRLGPIIQRPLLS